MKRKVVSGITLTLLLIGMLTLAFDIEPVEASGTIYIREDGSIEPVTANITTSDYVTYTFTDNNYDEIVVERSNITVDGTGYTLQGNGTGTGFDFAVNNVTIQNTNIKGFMYGVILGSNNTVSGNNITDNLRSHVTIFGSYNTVSGNNIYNSTMADGIALYPPARHNIISGNNIDYNDWDIAFYEGVNYNAAFGNNMGRIYYGGSMAYNIIYHNNFVDPNVYFVFTGSGGLWDDGYPSGGNYWSDYAGVDEKSGPNQDQPGSDGIGDTPYVFDQYNQDNYPLMNPVYDVTVNAYCYYEGVNVSVSVIMDGLPTGYTTPHNFVGLKDIPHNFTVPNSDPNGDPFFKWSTGETSTTTTINQGGIYTAYYQGKQYNLTITKTPGGKTEPSPGTYMYLVGTIVSVTAIPNSVLDCVFDHWELDDSWYYSNSISVTMDSNHTLHAVFKYSPPHYGTPMGGVGPPMLC